MRKNVFGRQLKRDKNERQALFKNLMSALVMEEKIQTTEEKAKSIHGHIEKLVTKARKGGTNIVSILQKDLTPPAAKKIVSDIAVRFVSRPGGYVRLIRLGERLSDKASMVLMEWVEGPSEKLKVKNEAPKKVKAEIKKEEKPKKITKKKTVK